MTDSAVKKKKKWLPSLKPSSLDRTIFDSTLTWHDTALTQKSPVVLLPALSLLNRAGRTRPGTCHGCSLLSHSQLNRVFGSAISVITAENASSLHLTLPSGYRCWNFVLMMFQSEISFVFDIRRFRTKHLSRKGVNWRFKDSNTTNKKIYRQISRCQDYCDLFLLFYVFKCIYRT